MKKIPDTSLWQPRKDSINTLKAIFYKRCLQIEDVIIRRVNNEKEFNLDSYDAGISVEEIIIEEFNKIFPSRYYVTNGIVNDRNGYTAGHQDLIIFNKTWFPQLKIGPKEESRRMHFPIEGVYALGEIKQTLTIEALDKAMEKLVIGKRLYRPSTGCSRIVENRELSRYDEGLTNSLYSFILAVNLDPKLSLNKIFNRFFEINKQLKREEIIDCLCVFQKGTITWSHPTIDGPYQPVRLNNEARFNLPILPILIENTQANNSSLYSFLTLLLAQLNDSILGSEDIVIAYGNGDNNIKIPPLEKYQINP